MALYATCGDRECGRGEVSREEEKIRRGKKSQGETLEDRDWVEEVGEEGEWSQEEGRYEAEESKQVKGSRKEKGSDEK